MKTQSDCYLGWFDGSVWLASSPPDGHCHVNEERCGHCALTSRLIPYEAVKMWIYRSLQRDRGNSKPWFYLPLFVCIKAQKKAFSCALRLPHCLECRRWAFYTAAFPCSYSSPTCMIKKGIFFCAIIFLESHAGAPPRLPCWPIYNFKWVLQPGFMIE